MTRPLILTAGVLAFALVAPTFAVFIPSQWTLGNFGDTSSSTQMPVGSVITMTGPANVFGNGSVTPTLMTISSGNSGTKGVTDFTATALASGMVTFTWTYQSFDMPCYDNGGYVVNNRMYVIACNGSGPLGGTTTFAVNAGEKFGFAVRTGDGLESSGTLKVNAFAFTGVIAPSVPDINSDGCVNGADLAILLGAWGTAGPVGDFNADNVVDGADLSILLGAWSC